MSEYFPKQVPQCCDTYWDIIEIQIGGFGLAAEADKVLCAHVEICRQCKNAKQSKIECPKCKGTGYSSTEQYIKHLMCGECGGAGWIRPQSEEK